MEEIFYRKYKTKSNLELQSIIDNEIQMTIEARNAARKLLNERENDPSLEIAEPLLTKPTSEYSDEKIEIHPSLDFRRFYDKITFKDILIPFSTALLFSLSTSLFIYFKLTIYTTVALISLIFVLLITNHRIFKSIHNESNIFIGRVCIDLLFFLFFVVCTNLLSIVIPSLFSITFNLEGSIIIILLGIIFFVVTVEVILTVLNKVSSAINFDFF